MSKMLTQKLEFTVNFRLLKYSPNDWESCNQDHPNFMLKS